MAQIGQVDRIEGLNTPPAIVLWCPVDLRDTMHLVSFVVSFDYGPIMSPTRGGAASAEEQLGGHPMASFTILYGVQEIVSWVTWQS
jgi:hypothetical protein